MLRLGVSRGLNVNISSFAWAAAGAEAMIIGGADPASGWAADNAAGSIAIAFCIFAGRVALTAIASARRPSVNPAIMAGGGGDAGTALPDAPAASRCFSCFGLT